MMICAPEFERAWEGKRPKRIMVYVWSPVPAKKQMNHVHSGSAEKNCKCRFSNEKSGFDFLLFDSFIVSVFFSAWADKSGDFSPFQSIVYVHPLPLSYFAPPPRFS